MEPAPTAAAVSVDGEKDARTHAAPCSLARAIETSDEWK
jgi:hypothetical protein